MKIPVCMAALLALSILPFAHVAQAGGGGHTFSNKSLKGTYVVNFQGTNSGGDGTLTGKSLGPINGAGVLISDGKGNFTGTQTANILFNTDGTPTSSGSCPGPFGVCTAICTTSLVGTYSVNPDGTGTTTATATPTVSDPRCGSPSGFTTTSDIFMQSKKHLVFVGTDFDETVGGQATRQGGEDGD